jgi:hypothetical protein
MEPNARIWLAFLPLTLPCDELTDSFCSSAAKMTGMQRPGAILSYVEPRRLTATVAACSLPRFSRNADSAFAHDPEEFADFDPAAGPEKTLLNQKRLN